MFAPSSAIFLIFLITILVALFRVLGLSTVLGYMFAGIIVGPSVLGEVYPSSFVQTLAELGVIFLMFTIGLEFSLPQLLKSRYLVLGLGGLQVLLSLVLFGGVLGVFWALEWKVAFIIAAALAMSSTAIVLKQLTEQLELNTPYGRVAVSILLFQDFMAAPFLVVLSVFSQGDQGALLLPLLEALIKVVALFIFFVFLGRRWLDSLLRWVASTQSLELFMLSALFLAASAAWISHEAQLSPALGAFMAGMLLGETVFRHQLEVDIRPFRDLLLGLFFVTIGMQLDVSLLWEKKLIILGLLISYMFLKFLIIAGVVRWVGRTSPAASLRSGLVLAQGGEFGLLLLAMGAQGSFLPFDIYQPLLATMILSMALAPFLIRYGDEIVTFLLGRRQLIGEEEVAERIAEVAENKENHVIICGFGRVGQNLARILEMRNIPYLALDLDVERLEQAAQAGTEVVFGDASRPALLQAAGLQRAKVVAVTFDQPELEEKVISAVRMQSRVPILARVVEDRYEWGLLKAGATVFPEGLESSLLFAAQLLILWGETPSSVERLLSQIRANDYQELRTFFHDTTETHEEAQNYQVQKRALSLNEGDVAVGKTPQELQLQSFGVKIVDVLRGGVRVPGRLLDTFLRVGDVLVLEGNPQELEKAEQCLKTGLSAEKPQEATDSIPPL